ncbi:MAG TPA: MotA/TolQ/ExbB proton channel family protein [Bryobacteraceae bacterium]|jgi:chemotaxis protein MotA
MASASGAVVSPFDDLSTPALQPLPPQPQSAPASRVTAKSLDVWMLAGVAVALAGTIGGIKSTGVSLAYFFQPAGVLIVLGGTFGIALITTPRILLRHSAQTVIGILRAETTNREALIEEIVSYARAVRMKGLVSIEHMLDHTSHGFLRDTIRLAMDVKDRDELQTILETKIRLRERQGETDAKVLEVAGGFAPTIGVLGTVIGLINILRQFSNLSAVATGIGTAFVSTLYGLALANLVLLPAAHRIRARVAETFELEEMMVEGGLCLFDGIHHSLVRERLNNFLRAAAGR